MIILMHMQVEFNQRYLMEELPHNLLGRLVGVAETVLPESLSDVEEIKVAVEQESLPAASTS